jgi:hypothetical protein
MGARVQAGPSGSGIMGRTVCILLNLIFFPEWTQGIGANHEAGFGSSRALAAYTVDGSSFCGEGI